MFKALLILIIAAYVIFVCVNKIRDLKKGKFCSCGTCDCGCCEEKCSGADNDGIKKADK